MARRLDRQKRPRRPTRRASRRCRRCRRTCERACEDALDEDRAGGVSDVSPDGRFGSGARRSRLEGCARRPPAGRRPTCCARPLRPRAPRRRSTRYGGLVDAMRSREHENRAVAAGGWLAVRGAHAPGAGAARQPRRALRSARNNRSGSAPLPARFWQRFTLIGDASCLEPIAAAWGASRDTTPDGARWRQQLASASPRSPTARKSRSGTRS